MVKRIINCYKYVVIIYRISAQNFYIETLYKLYLLLESNETKILILI